MKGREREEQATKKKVLNDTEVMKSSLATLTSKGTKNPVNIDRSHTPQ